MWCHYIKAQFIWHQYRKLLYLPHPNQFAMNIIKNFREQLGLSQQDLATYLCISKSQISMVESGLRELPTPALVKLAFFEQASLIPNDSLNKENNIHLVKHVELCTKKMMLLEKKLTSMKANFSKGVKLLQAVSKIKETLPSSKESKQDKQWLSAQEKVANKVIHDNSLASQKLLTVQIKALQYEIKLSIEK